VRRAECEAGVSTVKKRYPDVQLLRDVTLEMLDEFQAELPESTYRRCRYVIEENLRLLTATAALKASDYVTFGKMMYGSHEGLSTQYNVSCAELDFLVDIARKCNVLGARMMGGGFGGCTINLVSDEAYDAFIQEAKTLYKQSFGREPRVYEVHISDGSRQLKLD